MKASIVDLRYKTRDILEALERNESVTVLYHGKVKGTLHPAGKQKHGNVMDHPFFGMHEDGEKEDKGLSVLEEMDALRRPRHAV